MNAVFLEPNGKSGGLCLMWKDGIDIQIIDMQFNMINCIVTLDARVSPYLLSCLYGAVNLIDRNQQWSHLSNISHNYRTSWVILGDFNFILNNDEKEGGIPLTQNQLDVNNYLLQFAGLHSMDYIGNPYTWSNNRANDDLILSRLDRAATTLKLMSDFPTAGLYHLIPMGTDHCPIMLATSRVENATKKPFRVNSSWFRDNSCFDAIKKQLAC